MARFSPNLPLLFAALIFTTAAVNGAPKKRAASKATPAQATPPPTAPGELPLFAAGAIVIDGLTGETLYEKNADARFFPASTTKVMTALMIIEAGDLDRE